MESDSIRKHLKQAVFSDTIKSLEEYLTVKQAAVYLNLSEATIRSWIFWKKIPYIKLGGRAVRLRKYDLDALITAGYVKPVEGVGITASDIDWGVPPAPRPR